VIVNTVVYFLLIFVIVYLRKRHLLNKQPEGPQSR
jgi:hypothetical protein